MHGVHDPCANRRSRWRSSRQARAGHEFYRNGERPYDGRGDCARTGRGRAGELPAGGRTNWHTHPAGQILYVTEGCGWVQEDGSLVTRICKGDTIHARPGTKHWHGATNRQGMSHLAVTETINGKPVDWLEPVTASQYRGPTG
ncbi:cupin domain-containing protein [Sphingomonas sp. LR60]|uniref:cupin domain-containing protein n=1 Tax=Sphingomonas sp. LR60 TaxID=3050233 RepID=UPI002FE17352